MGSKISVMPKRIGDVLATQELKRLNALRYLLLTCGQMRNRRSFTRYGAGLAERAH